MQQESLSLHYHLVLLGQVGAGKSATGNTILGQRTFQSRKSLKAVTHDVQRGTVTINGLTLDIYDTPGFLGPGVQSGEIESKCQTLLHLDASKTVFLLVIDTDRFAEQEKRAADLVLRFLGNNNLPNTWIIFTKGDELESNEVTIDQYMEESDDLKELVQTLNHQYQVFNNKCDLSNREQAEELISQIMSTDMSISQNQLNPTSQPENHNQRAKALPTRDQSRPCRALVTGSKASDKNNNLPPRKILLLGKTGVGKSATGNTILGNEGLFSSKSNFNAVTKKSSLKCSNISGRDVSVIDTPGFFDTKLEQDLLAKEFARSLHLSEGGVHAFLLIFRYGRFTEQEQDTLRCIEKVFGKDVTKHIIIVFTHGDECDRENVNLDIQNNKFLPGLINKCGGRYHVINNRQMNNRTQVSELLQMIDTMVEANGERCYTNEMFKIANMGTFESMLRKFMDFFINQIRKLQNPKANLNKKCTRIHNPASSGHSSQLLSSYPV